jgi:hypothetical protein
MKTITAKRLNRGRWHKLSRSQKIINCLRQIEARSRYMVGFTASGPDPVAFVNMHGGFLRTAGRRLTELLEQPEISPRNPIRWDKR